MRAAFIKEVGDRLGAASGTARDQRVLEQLRALLSVLSETTHCLRLSSSDDESIARLQAVQRKKVRHLAEVARSNSKKYGARV